MFKPNDKFEFGQTKINFKTDIELSVLEKGETTIQP